MYTRARFKLTLHYSIVFLLFLWFLSFALYFWFSLSLGEGYIAKVRESHLLNPAYPEFNSQHQTTTIIAGNVALEQLRDILIVSNCFLVFIIPVAGWFLTKKTLLPIEKAFEQQKQFVSDASHEMRTPLSILSGEMEMALKKKRFLSYYQKIIKSAKEEINRLSLLIENLLFLAQADYGNQKFTTDRVDITALVNTLLFEFRSRIRTKNIQVDFNPAREAVAIEGQESMLRTMIANLVDNAIKYTPNGGKILLKIINAPRHIVLTVKDNGIGIDRCLQKKIFDRFYRADSSRSNTRGFGLGLSIVKSIIDRYRGKILIKSEVGRGSTVFVYLPKSA